VLHIADFIYTIFITKHSEGNSGDFFIYFNILFPVTKHIHSHDPVSVSIASEYGTCQ